MRSNDNETSWAVLPQRAHLFEQIAFQLEAQIQNGRWKPGEMIPSEAELAKSFSVALGTMRRALQILSEKGVLVRRQGVGTFVANYQLDASATASRYVKLVPDNGSPSLPLHTKLVAFEQIPADAVVANALQLRVGMPVLHVQRVHYIRSSQPVSFDEHFLPSDLFCSLTAEKMAHHSERVLYAFYQNEAGVTITGYRECIKAGLLSERLCNEYGFEPPYPVLIGVRIATSFKQRPVEYRIQQYTTQDYHFEINF